MGLRHEWGPGYTLITLFNSRELARIRDEQVCTVFGRTYMNREMALKIVLAVVGVLFLILAYPMVTYMRREPALSMMLSVYVTLGVFLLLAIRNPGANRSLIAFTAWSSFAHAALMGIQVWRNMIPHGELFGVTVLAAMGAALIALAPPHVATPERVTH
jgi:hypothetical protein